jgi:hypothetical protein
MPFVLQPIANYDFCGTPSAFIRGNRVNIRGIYEINTRIRGLVQNPKRSVLIALAAKGHGAKAQHTHLKTSISKRSKFHD